MSKNNHNTKHHGNFTNNPVQLIIDAYGCTGDINSKTKILDILIDAAHSIGANIVKKYVHKYDPHGISCYINPCRKSHVNSYVA